MDAALEALIACSLACAGIAFPSLAIACSPAGPVNVEHRFASAEVVAVVEVKSLEWICGEFIGKGRVTSVVKGKAAGLIHFAANWRGPCGEESQLQTDIGQKVLLFLASPEAPEKPTTCEMSRGKVTVPQHLHVTFDLPVAVVEGSPSITFAPSLVRFPAGLPTKPHRGPAPERFKALFEESGLAWGDIVRTAKLSDVLVLLAKLQDKSTIKKDAAAK